MKILVTGAAGYIGSVLCGMLLEEGHTVIGVDKLMYGGKSLLGIINHPRFSLINSDIYDTEKYAQYIDSETNIVNLAAVVGEPASKKLPEETTRTNVDAAKKLIDLAIEKKAAKFVFVSTCSNYGLVPEGEMAAEESELHPLSLYAETKVQIELYLKDQVKDTLNWTVLRFSTVYGLSPRPRFDLTVNDFTLHAITDKKLLIFLPKTNRPYIHTIDAARAAKLCLEKPEESRHQVFNVGDNTQNYRKIDIVEAVKKAVPDFEVEYVEKGHDLRDYAVNFDKIRSILGYEITKKVPDGVNEIAFAINSGMIKDPNNPEYYNA
ncbi:NAD(P)-dependent oxidoreductase [Mesotoga prima]|uniref:NAD-dependent epimerase/dehydratase family protein n=1 Tax=Mesotoga prima TaxID=1184387 RepID=UPI002FE0621C